VTEVPVQYRAVQYSTDSKQQTTQSGPDSSPHDFRHRNWVWGGLSRSNATTSRPGLALAHPWPAIHRTVLYASPHIVHPRPETKNEKSPHPQHQQAPGYATCSSGTLELAPNRTCPPAPSPRTPAIACSALHTVQAPSAVNLERSTLHLL
jgi:hypothetical protein